MSKCNDYKFKTAFGPHQDGQRHCAGQRKIANGAGCLAAQIVAHFKDGPGGVYLHHPSSKDCGQEYEYHITADTSGITVKVMEAAWTGHPAKTLYQGDVEGLLGPSAPRTTDMQWDEELGL